MYKFIIPLFLLLFTGCTYKEKKYISSENRTCILKCEELQNECIFHKNKTDLFYENQYEQCLSIKEKKENLRKSCQKPKFICNKLIKNKHKEKCEYAYYRNYDYYLDCKINNKIIFNNKYYKYKVCKKKSVSFNCTKNYDRCFKNCGGSIKYIEKDLF